MNSETVEGLLAVCWIVFPPVTYAYFFLDMLHDAREDWSEAGWVKRFFHLFFLITSPPGIAFFVMDLFSTAIWIVRWARFFAV